MSKAGPPRTVGSKGRRAPWRSAVGLALAAIAAVAVVLARRGGSPPGPPDRPAVPGTPPTTARRAAALPLATYVGTARCAECHGREATRWRGSHHDRAMVAPTPRSVVGDFADTTFSLHGVTTTFTTRNGTYVVRTDGPDGALRDYRVTHTFGVDPLQQYLIALSGGRIQALDIAWDARPAQRGGQRWMHLHPDERIRAGDPLHWTGPALNWNHMCADCHSTNVRKGWSKDRYETTVTESSVGCEACHGPGSRHVAWAALADGDRRRDTTKGLVAALGERAPWVVDLSTGVARPHAPAPAAPEIDTCAPCHARRAALAEARTPGRPLLEAYRPALLERELYFADGQIQDEVYEWGSFLQSRMHAAGVRCSDCHDPHGLSLRGGSANATCAGCHAAGRFDTRAHHFHDPASAAGQCTACHMPSRTYMRVDERHDHSFRVPRPDLSVTLGTPNACGACHLDHGAAWAADAAARWYPNARGRPHWAEALAAGRQVAANAEEALARLAADAGAPAIVRATAVSLLGRFPSPRTGTVLAGAAADGDPLLRLAAANAAEALPPAPRAGVLAPLLADPMLAVRVEAAATFATLPAELRDGAPAATQNAFGAALDEYRRVQERNGDRPDAHVNLGIVAARLGELDAAERAYREALRVGPWFVPTSVNLADLLRQRGRDSEAEPVLRDAVVRAPENASVHHALGLLLARTGREADALTSLARAAELDPDEPRYAYVRGVALHSSGRPADALAVLERAQARFTGDREILVALATITRDMGDLARARVWAERLVALAPGDPAASVLLEQLRSSAQ